MPTYFIRKSTRASTSPYSGPTCATAGVTPGLHYESLEDAERDAAALSKCNPVGFDVVQTGKDMYDPERCSRWYGGDRWLPLVK